MPRKTFMVEVHRSSSAEAAVLFTLLSDGARWSQWAYPLVWRSLRITDGDPAPGGVGAIRAITLGPLRLREQTTVHEQDTRQVYVPLSPLPIRECRAEVRFRPSEHGTLVSWGATFTERVPGTGALLRPAVRAVLTRLAGYLVRAAEPR